MGTESPPRAREFHLSVDLQPLTEVRHSFGTDVATAAARLVSDLYPHGTAARLDVVLSELINNVLEHGVDRGSLLRVRVDIADDVVRTRVSSAADRPTAAVIGAHIQRVQRATDKKALLASTINERRSRGVHGGLGLIRLAAETKAVLSFRHDKKAGVVHVSAAVALGE